MNPSEIIRPLTAADLDAVAALERLGLEGPWSREALAAELADGHADLLVCDGSEGVIGYVCALWLAGELEILRLVAHPQHRRRKVAQRLLDALIEQYRPRGLERMLLEVRTSNDVALLFYRQCGFRRCGRRRRYYADGEDALLLERLFP